MSQGMMVENLILLRKERLKLLDELNLLSTDRESIYDRLTALASKIVSAPVSLMSMVAQDRQVFKSEYGLPDVRSTPLSHSFCKHVVVSNQPLIVSDAREEEKLKDNEAIRDLGVIGYLGIPITVLDGQSLGSFCVIDHDVRDWTFLEVTIMQELAEILVRELDLRARTRLDAEQYAGQLAEAERKINILIDSLDLDQSLENILIQMRDVREEIKL